MTCTCSMCNDLHIMVHCIIPGDHAAAKHDFVDSDVNALKPSTSLYYNFEPNFSLVVQ